jgi:ElaB/YqjD/DUF883 family membrane-anchored ribosome-binding protein
MTAARRPETVAMVVRSLRNEWLHAEKECSIQKELSYSQWRAFTDSAEVPSFLKWSFRRRRWQFFPTCEEEAAMDETSESITSMNGPVANGTVVHRVAQRAHETVDKLEQTVSTGSERVMSMQEEYGAYAREQIKLHPLSTVAGAFVVGVLLGKILR